MPTLLLPQPSRSTLPDARHVVIPDGIVATGFPAAQKTCAAIGILFDDWQSDLNRLILAEDLTGDYAADTVALSIARQVGKTFDIGGLVFADSIIHPGTTTVWTAHRFKVARESFNEMRAWAKSPLLAPHIEYDDITTAAGNECIPFRNGSRILFAARERGAIRGFTKVRRLILDEAQILTHGALADMAPTQNQAVNPQIILMGTPPKPTDPGEVFADLRAEALEGRTDGVLYVELSAERGSDPDDRNAWRQANPSFPRRTPEKSIQRLRKLLSVDDFLREVLGIWDELAAGLRPIITADEWANREIDAAPNGIAAYGIKFSPDGATVALSVGVRPDDGPIHVEGVEHRSMIDGTRWLVDWLLARKTVARAVVIDGKAGAGGLITALQAARFPMHKVKRPTVDEVITAHAGFVQGIADSHVTHIDDPAMTSSVESAGRRPIGKTGGWGFGAIGDGDVTLVESAVLAHFGALTARKGTSQRKAVVM